MYEHERLIAAYSHERARPREAEALLTLQKVASTVKPIMRQRGWKVGVLKEFYPENPGLLGVNVNNGQSICLRLRYARDQKQFMPFEDVVDTMLHELCHNDIGPHNEAFHKLWDQLREEHESLLRKGYTGEGFLGKGNQLGGQRLPMQEARRRARAAAEKRRSLAAGSGQRLGGAPILRNVDIRNVIINAIERRRNITKGCPTNSQEQEEVLEETSKNGFKTQAQEDDANERAIAEAYMELVQEEQKAKYGKDYVEPSSQNPLGHQKTTAESDQQAQVESSGKAAIHSNQTPGVRSKETIVADTMEDNQAKADTKPAPSTIEYNQTPMKPSSTDARSKVPPLVPSEADLVNDNWTCEICTLNNPSSFLCCDACGTQRSTAPFSEDLIRNEAYGPSKNHSSSSRSPPPKSSMQEESKLRSSRTKQNLKKYAEWGEVENKKPLGWLCQRCGTFMESQWWSCSSCGTDRPSS